MDVRKDPNAHIPNTVNYRGRVEMPFMGTEARFPDELHEVADSLAGATLKNGAVVIDAGVRNGYFIVLAIIPFEADERYSTWAVSPSDGAAFWGHYHDTLGQALADFEARS